MLKARALAIAFAAAFPLHPARAQQPALPVLPAERAPGVDVWLDTDFYESQVKAEAFFNAIPGSYVTVVRVSNRNALEVLYPTSPSDQLPYERNPEARTRLAFRTDPGTGLGVIFAIASDKPFDYSTVSDGRKWNASRLAHPKGESVQEVAGYFFNEIAGETRRRFSLAQAAYINGAAVFKVGDPGFPTVSSVLDATNIACNWAGRDTQGRVCGDTTAKRPMKDLGKPTGIITGTMANPPPPQSAP